MNLHPFSSVPFPLDLADFIDFKIEPVTTYGSAYHIQCESWTLLAIMPQQVSENETSTHLLFGKRKDVVYEELEAKAASAEAGQKAAEEAKEKLRSDFGDKITEFNSQKRTLESCQRSLKSLSESTESGEAALSEVKEKHGALLKHLGTAKYNQILREAGLLKEDA